MADSLKQKGSEWNLEMRKKANSQYFSANRKVALLEHSEPGSFGPGDFANVFRRVSEGQVKAVYLRVLANLITENKGQPLADTVGRDDLREGLRNLVADKGEPALVVVNNMLLEDPEEKITGLLFDYCGVLGFLLSSFERPSPQSLLLAMSIIEKKKFACLEEPTIQFLEKIEACYPKYSEEMIEQVFPIASFLVCLLPTRDVFEQLPNIYSSGLKYFSNIRSHLENQDLCVACLRLLASYLFCFDGRPDTVTLFTENVALDSVVLMLQHKLYLVRQHALWLVANFLTETKALLDIPEFRATLPKLVSALFDIGTQDLAFNRKEALTSLYYLFELAPGPDVEEFAPALAQFFIVVLRDGSTEVVKTALHTLKSAAKGSDHTLQVMKDSAELCEILNEMQYSKITQVADLATEIVKFFFD